MSPEPADAAAPVEVSMPFLVLHDMHQLHHGGVYYLDINITAERAGPGTLPFSLSTGLGRRIADLIREDVTGKDGT